MNQTLQYTVIAKEYQPTSPPQLGSMDSQAIQRPLHGTGHQDLLPPLIDAILVNSAHINPPTTHHCRVNFAVDSNCIMNPKIPVADGDTLGIEIHECLQDG